MRRIKLMADYQCYPLWEADPGVFGDLSPDDLPLSKNLRDDLSAWAEQFDATLDMSDPSRTGFDTQESADKFVATGYELLARLSHELGSNYQVTSYIKASTKKS